MDNIEDGEDCCPSKEINELCWLTPCNSFTDSMTF
jgi:hypothetical protein